MKSVYVNPSGERIEVVTGDNPPQTVAGNGINYLEPDGGGTLEVNPQYAIAQYEKRDIWANGDPIFTDDVKPARFLCAEDIPLRPIYPYRWKI